MPSQEQIKKDSKGQSIYLKEWIPESVKGTVVLVHGLGEHIGRYEHVANAFNAAGYAVMGFDLPGHGCSGGVRGHVDSYETLMNLIASRLADAAQVYPNAKHFLYGHSLGGNLVLYYGLTRKPQLSGIIATSPAVGLSKELPSFQLFMAKVLSAISPSTTMDNGLDLAGLSHDQAVIQAYKDDPLVHGKISMRLAVNLVTSGKYLLEHAAEFPSLPLLLLQGSEDRLVNPAATDAFAKKCLAKITYNVYPGLYHELHNEFEKAEIIQTMISWMDEQK